MTASTSLPGNPAPILNSRAKADAARWFYSGASILLLVLAFIGFHRFYLHGRAFPDRELTPPIRGQVILHGVIMSAWMLLFALQPMLIAARRHRVHMRLGWLAAALAAGVLVTGVHLAIRSAQVTPPEALIWGLPGKAFMAVPFLVSIVFGAFVAVAVWKRRRPQVHRAMMLMGTLTAMSAAISRIDTLNNLYVGTIWERIWGPFFTTMLIGALLVLANWAMTRRFDRTLAAAFAAVTVIFILIWQIAPTPVWVGFASVLVD